MKTLWCGMIVLVAGLACKPIAKQEPISNEQSAAASLSRLIIKGKFGEARQLLRQLITQENYMAVGDAIATQVSVGNYDAPMKFIATYRVQIPHKKITAQVTEVSSSADVDQLTQHLATLRHTLEDTRKDFTAINQMLFGFPKSIRYREAAFDSVRTFHQEQVARLKKEFADWSEPLLEQIETGIRASYRQSDGTRLGATATLEQVVEGKVLDEWLSIKATLTSKYGAGGI